ncbi:DNA-directed RNA polymerase subunit omega [Lutibacter sp. B2]|nr:DNA-directed RNA polymerase subunit omega [Lutibacter sp. B2]
MLNPSVNELIKKVDSRYTLVTAVSKRAREIVEGASPLIKISSKKPVTIATYEMDAGKIAYTRDEEVEV